jgi:type IV pilus assembly protein PilW
MAMNMLSLRPAGMRARSRGFTLIELMVAAAIGLIVALALTSAVVATGRQYSMISASVAAQNSAQVGLSLIDLSARSAGSGFYANGQPICPTWNAFSPASGAGATAVAARTITNAVFMPVRITDGGSAGASDTIEFTGGSGTIPFASVPVLTNTSGAGNMEVPQAGAFAVGDIAVIGAPGSGLTCTLFQVTGTSTPGGGSCGAFADACTRLSRAVSTGVNAAAAPANAFTFATNTTGGVTYTGPAVVSRVATTAAGFRQEAFRIECNSLVRYNAFPSTPGGCTATPLSFATGGNPVDAIASDIVLMHAQYGITASAASDVVVNWVDASGGTWGAPTAANVARIKAIRVVMVARSKEPDGGEVTAASCANGATPAVTNTGPCSFQDTEAPVIDLSGIAVPAGRTWQNYRYRVHMAIMPLRSVIWSD